MYRLLSQPWTATVKIGDQFLRDGLLCEVVSVKIGSLSAAPAGTPTREEPTLCVRMLEASTTVKAGTIHVAQFRTLEPPSMELLSAATIT